MDITFAKKQRAGIAQWPNWAIALLFFSLLFGCFLARAEPPSVQASESEAMQKARTIQLAMFQYEYDHGGKYPVGKSSTEVFQKLFDGHYLNVPDAYYLDMPGKIRPKDNASRLSPESVCFDVTIPLTDNSPDNVPSVFATGYRIEYKTGGNAIPLLDKSRPQVCTRGLPVAYHNNDAYFKKAFSTGVVSNIIPAGADIGPGPYTQLTPNGPLPGK